MRGWWRRLRGHKRSTGNGQPVAHTPDRPPPVGGDFRQTAQDRMYTCVWRGDRRGARTGRDNTSPPNNRLTPGFSSFPPLNMSRPSPAKPWELARSSSSPLVTGGLTGARAPIAALPGPAVPRPAPGEVGPEMTTGPRATTKSTPVRPGAPKTCPVRTTAAPAPAAAEAPAVSRGTGALGGMDGMGGGYGQAGYGGGGSMYGGGYGGLGSSMGGYGGMGGCVAPPWRCVVRVSHWLLPVCPLCVRPSLPFGVYLYVCV